MQSFFSAYWVAMSGLLVSYIAAQDVSHNKLSRARETKCGDFSGDGEHVVMDPGTSYGNDQSWIQRGARNEVESYTGLI